MLLLNKLKNTSKTLFTVQKSERLLYNRFTKPSESVLIKGQKALAELTAVEVKIESVSALDDTNKYLQINFNDKVSKLAPSDIQIKDAKKGDLYGVKAVTLAADGKSAQLELFENTEST